jgi:hypothetical protein
VLTMSCQLCGKTMAALATAEPTELTSVCTDCLRSEVEDTDLEDTPLFVGADPEGDDAGLVRIFREAGLGHFLEDLGGEEG